MLRSFYRNDYDLLSFAGLIFITLTAYLFIPRFLSLYRDTFRNLRATEKQVIKARIINIEKRWASKGNRLYIDTEFMIIDTSKNVVLTPGVIFPHLHIGDSITIHIIPNNKYDMLKIENH